MFLVADKRLYKRLCPSVGRSVGWLVGWSVTLESRSGKTRISAPAHPSATGIGRVSGLVSNFREGVVVTEDGMLHLPLYGIIVL